MSHGINSHVVESRRDGLNIPIKNHLWHQVSAQGYERKLDHINDTIDRRKARGKFALLQAAAATEFSDS